jgi:lysyl-tRNA synthetase class 2
MDRYAEYRNIDLSSFDSQELSDLQSPVVRARLAKAAQLAQDGVPLYPNAFRPLDKAADVRARVGGLDREALNGAEERCTLGGRLMARRDYGKSVFLDLCDSSGRIQLYAKKDAANPALWELLGRLDLGDLVGVSGRLFKTRTDELTVLADSLELVSKGLLPLPEKYHDL